MINLESSIPVCFRTDSYKFSHFEQYDPSINGMYAYSEARKGLDLDDDRIVFYGMEYIVENVLNHKWTHTEVDELRDFCADHNAGGTFYNFPEKLFRKFIDENDGYFPILVKALQEGSVVYPHTCLYTLETYNEYAPLCTYLESALMQVWYATTVATLSRRVRTIIEDYFELTVDEDAYWKLDSRLHDFGYRGTTCLEQSVLGGVAHLLNFRGSDTVPALYYGKKFLNNGVRIGESIPATEHSVMTTWNTEDEAVKHIINKYAGGVYATVGDSYSWDNYINNVVKDNSELKNTKGGFWVVRPDSGNSVKCIVDGLFALEKAFGTTLNKKGYKVITGAGLIQGDGISKETVKAILQAVMEARFSVENVAFGMGGGLLQKVNRDTLSFATKISYIEKTDEDRRYFSSIDIMKNPSTDLSKASMSGLLQVNSNGFVPQTYPLEAHWEDYRNEVNMLEIVYHNGPVKRTFRSFDLIRESIKKQMLVRPKKATGKSNQIEAKQIAWVKEHQG